MYPKDKDDLIYIVDSENSESQKTAEIPEERSLEAAEVLTFEDLADIPDETAGEAYDDASGGLTFRDLAEIPDEEAFDGSLKDPDNDVFNEDWINTEDNASDSVSGGLTFEDLEDIPDETSGEAFDEVQENTDGEYPGETPEDYYEEYPGEAPEDYYKEYPGETPEDYSEEYSGDTPEDYSDEYSGDTPEDIGGPVPGEAQEDSSEDYTAEASEELTFEDLEDISEDTAAEAAAIAAGAAAAGTVGNTADEAPAGSSEDSSGEAPAETTEKAAGQTKPEPNQDKKNKKAAKLILLVVILAVLIILVIAGLSIKNHYEYDHSAEHELREAFAACDYQTCQQILTDNQDDEDVIAAAHELFDADAESIAQNFKTGQVEYSDAMQQLADLETVTAGVLSEEIGRAYNTIVLSDEKYADLQKAREFCEDRQFGKAMETLMDVSDLADEYDLNFRQIITEILKDYYYELKSYLFKRYASEIKVGEWDHSFISKSAAFFAHYYDDPDFREYLDIVKKAEEGEITINYASNRASEIADESDDMQKAMKKAKKKKSSSGSKKKSKSYN